MKIRLHAFALALLLAASPAAAQPGHPPEGGRPGAATMDEERRPFEMLVRARRELELTDPQVERLREIAVRLEARNRPLRQRLRAELASHRREERARIEGELRRLPAEERRRRLRELWDRRHERALPEHIRPVAEEMRRNIRQATAEAQTVLTPRQKARVRRLLEEHRGRGRERRPGAPRRPHADGGRLP